MSIKLNFDVLKKALEGNEDAGVSDRLEDMEESFEAVAKTLEVVLNKISEIQQHMGEEGDEEDEEDLEKALDLKDEINKLGNVDDIEREADSLPADLEELMKGIDPSEYQSDDDEDDDLAKALDLFSDQNVIHVVEGSSLHDLLKASGGHKYLRRYKGKSGKWVYVYANKKNPDSYSASAFKLDKMAAGDKFNMGGGATVKIDKVEGNMVTFTGTDGKQKTMSAKAFGDNLLGGHKKALQAAAKKGVEKREAALAKAKESGKEKLIKKAQSELSSFKDKHSKLLRDSGGGGGQRGGFSMRDAFKQQRGGNQFRNTGRR